MRALGLLLLALIGCRTSPIGLPSPDLWSAAPADLAGAPPDLTATTDGSTTCNGRVPLHHRPSGATCPTSRGAGTPDTGFPGACTKDSECTQGQNGRCMPNGPVPGNSCSYDGCFSDNDCHGNEACWCRDSAASNVPNFCVPAKCRIDADCGPCGYCSPSGAQFCPLSYQCHTASDVCLDDADCTDASKKFCSWDDSATHWTCQSWCPPPPTPPSTGQRHRL